MRRTSRPCSVCGKWFEPDARVGRRQRCCSRACGRERHRRSCAAWNARESPKLREARGISRAERAIGAGVSQDESERKVGIAVGEVIRLVLVVGQDEMRRIRKDVAVFPGRDLGGGTQDCVINSGMWRQIVDSLCDRWATTRRWCRRRASVRFSTGRRFGRGSFAPPATGSRRPPGDDSAVTRPSAFRRYRLGRRVHRRTPPPRRPRAHPTEPRHHAGTHQGLALAAKAHDNVTDASPHGTRFFGISSTAVRKGPV